MNTHRSGDVLPFYVGMRELRGDEAYCAWADRIAVTPMIPGTLVRAPRGDRRHGWSPEMVVADCARRAPGL